jgi:hypothetical protein
MLSQWLSDMDEYTSKNLQATFTKEVAAPDVFKVLVKQTESGYRRRSGLPSVFSGRTELKGLVV